MVHGLIALLKSTLPDEASTIYPSVDTSRFMGRVYMTMVCDAASPYMASTTGKPMNI